MTMLHWSIAGVGSRLREVDTLFLRGSGKAGDSAEMSFFCQMSFSRARQEILLRCHPAEMSFFAKEKKEKLQQAHSQKFA